MDKTLEDQFKEIEEHKNQEKEKKKAFFKIMEVESQKDEKIQMESKNFHGKDVIKNVMVKLQNPNHEPAIYDD